MIEDNDSITGRIIAAVLITILFTIPTYGITYNLTGYDPLGILGDTPADTSDYNVCPDPVTGQQHIC